jgi:uncharacterized cupin superfamily protein
MQRVKVADIPWQEQHSPSRKFHSFGRNISVGLGTTRNLGTWGGGHPFDLQIRRIPPGASVCPFHLHLAQWEMFVVLAGSGRVRTSETRTEVREGDVFFHPPGAAHQITNDGPLDLEVLIIADNPPLDGCFYPDSNKWALRPPGKIFRITEADYFDGEDTADATGDSAYRPAPAPPQPAVAPFAERKLHLDAITWEVFESPKKKFRGWSKELSIALGAKRNTPAGLGGHPFDLELQKLAPREAGCPFHSHAAQWELYYVLNGSASMRTESGAVIVEAGEVTVHQPGDAHQISNASATDDLLFYVVADNPPADYWHYPDSGKWGLRAPRKFFRITEADYWDGEE